MLAQKRLDRFIEIVFEFVISIKLKMAVCHFRLLFNENLFTI